MSNSSPSNFVGIIAVSSCGSSYAPVSETTLYSLIPERVRKEGRSALRQRLVALKLYRHSKTGKIVSRMTQKWDVESLKIEQKSSPNTLFKQYRAATDMQTAMNQRRHLPITYDLPLFLDVSASPARSLDWQQLETDVVSGINGKFPFKWEVAGDMSTKIKNAIPFLDVGQHFRSIVDNDDIVMSLMRQLMDQHSPKLNCRSLLPVRWLEDIKQNDPIFVEIGSARSVPVQKLFSPCVSVGALDVKLFGRLSSKGTQYV